MAELELATVNLTNTQPVQGGSDSIAVNAGAYHALDLHQTAFDSTPYNTWCSGSTGGSSGVQLLQVQATLNGTAQTVVTLPALAANTWQQMTIPLASLGVQSKPNIDAFWIQDRSGTTRRHFTLTRSRSRRPPPPSA